MQMVFGSHSQISDSNQSAVIFEVGRYDIFYRNSNWIAITDCSHNKSLDFISHFLLSGFQQSMPCTHKIWSNVHTDFPSKTNIKYNVQQLSNLEPKQSSMTIWKEYKHWFRNGADKRCKHQTKNLEEFSTFVLNAAIFILFYCYFSF